MDSLVWSISKCSEHLVEVFHGGVFSHLERKFSNPSQKNKGAHKKKNRVAQKKVMAERLVFSLMHEVVYRIAWHVDDHRSWRSFALVNRLTAKAARYWMKTKKTQFRTPFYDTFVLPNGEFHGPVYTTVGTCYYQDGNGSGLIIFYDGRRSHHFSDLSYYIRRGEWRVKIHPTRMEAIRMSDAQHVSFLQCSVCNQWHWCVNRSSVYCSTSGRHVLI
jgi:hypothetical protein